MLIERNILFRGKEVESGEWVEGYAFKTDDRKSYIIPIHSKNVYECAVEVISETVGQYTGLKDIHNILIYEGDVINVYHNGELLNVSCVYFSDGEYKCRLISGGFIDLIETLPEQHADLGIEIIGNIFDYNFEFKE